MRTTLVIVAVIALLALAGCAQKAMPSSAPTATDQEVDAVGMSVSEIDSLTEDLGTEDLNALDQELADIENLELQ
jgi:outer membrane murein-binding lipoprotein Lpp